MELRNRNIGQRRDGHQAAGNVTLGPTVYAGERFSKMSERMKRQDKPKVDPDRMANQILAPGAIGFSIALICLLVYLYYMATSSKRNKQV